MSNEFSEKFFFNKDGKDYSIFKKRYFNTPEQEELILICWIQLKLMSMVNKCQ